MKLLLFASYIALFGCSASNSVEDLLHQMQLEIQELKISNEATKRNYDEKIRSLEKNYAGLEKQLGSGKTLATQTGNTLKVFEFLSIHSFEEMSLVY